MIFLQASAAPPAPPLATAPAPATTASAGCARRPRASGAAPETRRTAPGEARGGTRVLGCFCLSWGMVSLDSNNRSLVGWVCFLFCNRREVSQAELPSFLGGNIPNFRRKRVSLTHPNLKKQKSVRAIGAVLLKYWYMAVLTFLFCFEICQLATPALSTC